MTTLDPAILITGLGAISASGGSGGSGAGVDALWADVAAGVSRAHWAEAKVDGALVPLFTAPEPTFEAPHARHAHGADRAARLALAAALEAARDAKLFDRPIDPTRLAVILGSARGPVETNAEIFTRFSHAKCPRVSRLPAGSIVSLSGCIGAALDAQGPCFTVSAACASAAYAVILGAGLISSGVVDVVLAGGADTVVHPALLDQFARAGVIASHEDPAQACRPFCVGRNGAVFGEGAGVLVLESARSARRREVPAHAALAGYGFCTEHATRTGVTKCASGLERALRASLAMARANPDFKAIGYLNAHGTGTQNNDIAESIAIRAAFDNQPPPVSSTKPITGHCAGATPALEAIVCIRALHERLLPPSLNAHPLDPAIHLPIIHDATRIPHPFSTCSTSLGFWGVAASLIFTSTPRAD